MRRILLPLFVLTTVLAGACSVGKGELRPLNPTPTGGPSFSRQPQLVSFSELQAWPDRYQDRFIRVSGAFSPVEVPTCRPRSGPFVTWSLVADNLRLDVVGYEELAGRVAVDEAFTVDGYFRLYEGPWGCGKEPQVDTIWYLEVARVVQPNPIRLVSRGLEGPLPMVILAPRIGSAFTSLPDASEIEGELPDTGPPDALGSPMPTQDIFRPEPTHTAGRGYCSHARAYRHNDRPGPGDFDCNIDAFARPFSAGQPYWRRHPDSTCWADTHPFANRDTRLWLPGSANRDAGRRAHFLSLTSAHEQGFCARCCSAGRQE
jgi:hypothetical protein